MLIPHTGEIIIWFCLHSSCVQVKSFTHFAYAGNNDKDVDENIKAKVKTVIFSFQYFIFSVEG